MFTRGKVKIERELMEKIKRYSEIAAYSSPQEFITHAHQKEIATLEEAGDSDEEIRNKLKGLGYIS